MFAGLRKYIPIATLIAGMSFYLLSQFNEVIKCPSCHVFVDSGDGLKNYFTPAYFVKHDPAGLWSNGMNYPYGEHIVYTDNQPIISLLMKAAGTVIDMDEHVIGTINMLMIISLLIAAICLFLLLRSMGLPRWYAALMSVPLAILSPQIARFNGHYSLAYVFYLPLFLLLLVEWGKSGLGWKRGIWLVAWVVFMGFTHLYFFFIAMVFLVCFAFVHFLLGRFRWNKTVSRALVVILASASIVYGTVKGSDPITDRPDTVYGINVYTAKPAGAFLPPYRQANKIWEKLGAHRPDIEGRSYIGAPGVLLLPLVLLFAMISVVRRYVLKRNPLDAKLRLDSNPGHPVIIYCSSILVWFIATGWIYEQGGGILVDWFPVIGQFRSLGRLAWIFYYALGIYTVYAMYIVVRTTHHRLARTGMIGVFAILTAFWIWEAHTYLNETVTDKRFSTNTTFSPDTPFSDLLSKNGYDSGDFQAILQFPLVSIGAEKIKIERGAWFMRQAWQCAWETGLPIVNSVMSRTSMSQTMSLIQLISDPYIDKVRLKDMDERPLVLLASKDRKPLIKAEKRVIALADSIGEVNDMRVFTISIDKLAKYSDPPADRYVYKKDFDDQKTDLAFTGQGALLTVRPRTETFSFTDTFTTRKVLEYSSWSYLGTRTPVFVSIRHEIFNTAGDMVKRTDYNMHTYDPHNVIGNWIETRFFFGVDGSGAVHKFYVEPGESWVDKIRIR
jgi:hypothetical protein